MKYKLTYKISHSLKGYAKDSPMGAVVKGETFKDSIDNDGSWNEVLAIAETRVKTKIIEMEATEEIHRISIKLRPEDA